MKTKSKAKASTKSYTHIAIILDRSGSMTPLANEIIGGFNAFLAEQKSVPGDATLTLVQFDNEIDRLASFKPLADVADLTDKTYVPRGMTKLYDAIGLTVRSTIDDIAKAPRKPDKVLVVILTDGLENSSQEYTLESIKALLADQQKAGWEFSFIGANQDAVLTAGSIGIKNQAANITFAATTKGTANIMRSLSGATAAYRCAAQGEVFAYAKKDHDLQADSGLDPKQAAAFSHKAAFSEHGSSAGILGGAARAQSLSPKARTDIARKAAEARWSSKSV